MEFVQDAEVRGLLKDHGIVEVSEKEDLSRLQMEAPSGVSHLQIQTEGAAAIQLLASAGGVNIKSNLDNANVRILFFIGSLKPSIHIVQSGINFSKELSSIKHILKLSPQCFTIDSTHKSL